MRRRCKALAAQRVSLAAHLRQPADHEALLETVREAVAELQGEISSLRSLITDCVLLRSMTWGCGQRART